jgi:enoyl-CoA hydratase/carnithine racemase
VIVLAARGRGFCAGHDLRELRANSSDEGFQRRLFRDCNDLMVSLTLLPAPVIARVHGVATAAGCQLVSMCDLAVASETATFALPGVSVGLFCSTPAVGVARNIGRKRAMDLLLTGAPIDARTALDWGLVNRVVPETELDDAVQRYVTAIVERSPAVVRLGKKTFYEQIELPLAPAYDVAARSMVENALLPDAAAGMDAFFARRNG